MPLCRFHTGDPADAHIGFLDGEQVIAFPELSGLATMREVLRLTRTDLGTAIARIRNAAESAIAAHDATLLAPIDEQEVWACGVTYLRSRDARMEESTEQDVYERVYNADRPELFFKATPSRVSGPGQPVGIRADSRWDVPEPEVALVINAYGEVIGYTVGNDMSSRSIEGENPLYLPQAKMYTACAGLGPVIALADEITDPRDLTVKLTIERGGTVLFEEETSTDQMARSFEDLVGYLHRHNTFPDGVFLMTGTGIIPPSEFTLEDDDLVSIAVEGIGALAQPVTRLSTTG
ncbi:MAG TPA: fumarylacetoacetate hydrolase family protein [Thermomicrobiales bacterium]|nr:fumarylacetoacetate hydrolase family protein [Thermomicrobiales bacterium]